MTKEDIPLSGLGLDVRCRKALARNGLKTVGELRHFSGSILSAPNFGEGSFRRLRKAVESFGIRFDNVGRVVQDDGCTTPIPVQLRDFFAALAMVGLLVKEPDEFTDRTALAEDAYEFAKAMLRVRASQS